MRLSPLTQELAKEIEDEFKDVPYPGDDAMLSSPSAPEGRRYRADFLGRHWREVIDPEFLQQHATLRVLSVAARRFYLPAFLIGAIDYPNEARDWVDAWTEQLYPRFEIPCSTPVKELVTREWNQLTEALTAGQKHAIRLFLDHLLATQADAWWEPEPPGNLIARMIANYWGQF
ncbi:MAG: hypothetical protein ABSH42_06220 [Bryobacteraceae bacterium]|jgi:hypothetical protein